MIVHYLISSDVIEIAAEGIPHSEEVSMVTRSIIKASV